jgi:acetyltransferase-like isoleucine patch superfamily enzyme
MIIKWLARRLSKTPVIWGDPTRLKVGRNTRLVNTLVNLASGSVTIEDDVFFGHNCMVLTGTHDYREEGVARQTAVPQSGRDVVVGAGAWIGSGAIILGPCRIGAHAVVAAGSVVTDDIPARSIAAGAPARVVRTTTASAPRSTAA